LEILTEHLRVEVEPFGVRVLSVVTGAVKSKGQTYFEDWSLPEDSIYKPIEELVHQRANGIDEAKREPTMWWKISSAALPEKFGGVVERGRSSLDPRFCHRRSW
jgi:NAD(P)-dependent dehydrogenase (short-subunit alcohol dehydrogenase family)